MSSAEVIDLDSMFSSTSKRLTEAPKDTVLGKILPLEKEPSIVLYGPTKGGKTRLAAWEATAIASQLSRRALFLITESNTEPEDIRDILAACMYHGVYCEINRIDFVKGLVSFVRSFTVMVEKAIKKNVDISTMPRVVVIDSLSGLANLIIEGLSENIIESGAPTTLPYIYPPLTKVVNPIRRILSADYLNGYLIMVAHETQLRGEKYTPTAPLVKSKPKYAGSAQYLDDSEVWLGTPSHLPDNLKTCQLTKNNPSIWRPIVVVKSRRSPDAEGRGAAITFLRGEGATFNEKGKPTEGKPVEVKGFLQESTLLGGSKWVWIPADMAGEDANVRKFRVKPLKPVLGCGPKKI